MGTISATDILLVNASISAACFLVLWLVSLRIRDVSFVDSWWALGIVVLAVSTFVQLPSAGIHATLLVVLGCAWGLRLGIYLLWRWLKHGVDARYPANMKSPEVRHGWSFAFTAGVQVFLLQGILQFIVALPVQMGQIGEASPTLGLVALAGAGIALAGLAFETIGDWQLVRFKANPENKGRVLDTGLWRYTRHPNYFGDACVGWGLFLIASETTLGLWTLPAPVLLTFLLTRVSGVPLLEDQLGKTRPGYADYVARTPAFVPWFPRRKQG